MSKVITPEQIKSNIAKGVFKPNIYLTHLALAFFQKPSNWVSRRMFPIVPVQLHTAKFYEFDKGDLARLNVAPKPEYGHVQPGVFGKRDHIYDCQVAQVITGIDAIASLDFQRTNAPGVIDPRRAKVRWVTEQLNLYMDDKWAKQYFTPTAWTNVYTGVDTPPTAGQFYYLDNDNCDPVKMINAISTDMLRKGLRNPNKMCLGQNAFNAMQSNPSILERIKYQGSEANPANVTENVLAQLFKLDEVVVAGSVINRAKIGQEDDMEFICNPNDVLLTYTTDAPAIDEPSAGYTFAWDMLGNGQYIALQQYLGEPSTHTEFVEGLCAIDPQVCAPDLGVFLQNAVSDSFTPPIAA